MGRPFSSRGRRYRPAALLEDHFPPGDLLVDEAVEQVVGRIRLRDTVVRHQVRQIPEEQEVRQLGVDDRQLGIIEMLRLEDPREQRLKEDSLPVARGSAHEHMWASTKVRDVGIAGRLDVSDEREIALQRIR